MIKPRESKTLGALKVQRLSLEHGYKALKSKGFLKQRTQSKHAIFRGLDTL